MTRARRELISLESTSYYHCISRCVRRAFLCGEDTLTGKSYEHRKVWVTERLRELAEIFAIDICAYAVMSNHYHLVLRVDRLYADNWSESEVMERWTKLFKLPLLVARYERGEPQREAEQKKAKELIELWRERLRDISWYMRCLNEHLARMANEEDNCKGRFWEGRFKSQALLDDAAVLAAMSYVDLNPIRAGIAELPEDSDFTTIQQRIREVSKVETNNSDESLHQVPITQLTRRSEQTHVNAIDITEQEYIELVDWAGRAVREDKRGAITESAPPVLERLGINEEGYLRHISGRTRTEDIYIVGQWQKVKAVAEQLGRKFIKGMREMKCLYTA